MVHGQCEQVVCESLLPIPTADTAASLVPEAGRGKEVNSADNVRLPHYITNHRTVVPPNLFLFLYHRTADPPSSARRQRMQRPPLRGVPCKSEGLPRERSGASERVA